MAERRVVVVGAGAQGLHVALALLHERAKPAGRGRLPANVAVEVLSAASGMAPPVALWELPAVMLEPEARVSPWVRASFHAFVAMHAEHGAACGLAYPVPNYVMSRSRLEPLGAAHVAFLKQHARYRDGAAVLREAPVQRATEGRAHLEFADCQAYDTVTLRTRAHLAWLRGEVLRLGGTFASAELRSLRDAGPADVVINCAGLGAGALVGDGAVLPIKGQSLQVRGMPHVRCCMLDADKHVVCMVARHDGVGHDGVGHDGVGHDRVGGDPGDDGAVDIGGVREVGNWDRRPSAAATRDLLARAGAMLPAIRSKDWEEDADPWTGLRPGREGGVRFEMEPGKPGDQQLSVIHCYGHGGGGIITAPGAAQDVLALAVKALATSKL